MKRIDTVIRNQKLIEKYVRLICNHEKPYKAVYHCSEEFNLKVSTVQTIIDTNPRLFKKNHAKFNKCTIKIKKP